jgi:predicted nucleic acid-binding protein
VKPALYLDTSAILSGVLENGLRPDVERQIADAPALLTSRLSIVESARALMRIRQATRVAESRLADVSRQLDALWARCDIWEITPSVCELAASVAPAKPLRALDALHLATYLLARRRLGDVELLTADSRMRDAAEHV